MCCVAFNRHQNVFFFFFKTCRYQCSCFLLGSRCQAGWRQRKPMASWLLLPCGELCRVRDFLSGFVVHQRHLSIFLDVVSKNKKTSWIYSTLHSMWPAYWHSLLYTVKNRRKQVQAADKWAQQEPSFIKWDPRWGLLYQYDCILGNYDLSVWHMLQLKHSANPSSTWVLKLNTLDTLLLTACQERVSWREVYDNGW